MADFGVGTFFTLGNAAYNAWKAFNAAGPAFRDLAADTKTLNQHLDSTSKLLKEHGYKLKLAQQESVVECAQRCNGVVRKAQDLLKKYPSLTSKKGRIGERLAASILTDVESLRRTLQTCVTFLSQTETSIIASMIAEGQDRIHSVRRILSEVKRDIGVNRKGAPLNSLDMPEVNRGAIIPIQNRVVAQSGGRPPLHEACAAGNTDLVSHLLRQGSNPTVRTQGSKGNALHIATWYGNLPIMRLLLDDAPIPTVIHSQEITSKTNVIRERGKSEMIVRASRSRELIEMRDVDQDTPLHIAVEKRNLAAVQLLLTKGAKSTINTRNSSGRTPLHIAAKDGLVDIAQILLSNGARTSLKDNDGFTALALAKKGQHEQSTLCLEKHIEKRIKAKAVKAKVYRGKKRWFG